MHTEKIETRRKAYRRYMESKKNRRLRKIITECHCMPRVGYIEREWVDGVLQHVGDHIRYLKNSNIQKYLKRQTRRKVRRSETFPNGNGYRKCVEYKWTFWVKLKKIN